MRGLPEPVAAPSPEEEIASLEAAMPRIRSLLSANGHVGVLALDLEPLSVVESECGSAVYDELLARICLELDRLRNQVIRATDVVCRLRPHGEQLVVFLEGAHGPGELSDETIERVADRLWLALSPRISELSRPHGCSTRLRLGFALVLPNSMIKPERLIYRAVDQARAMAADHSRRVDLRARELLRDLIVQRQLRTVFQPIVEMGEGGSTSIQAYEALIRGPEGSDLNNPAMLFELARQLDLIHELDRACCHTNLSSASSLPPPTLLFANVLPNLLNDSEFRGWLVEKAQANFQGRLVLEINEGVAIRNHEMLSRGVEELRQGGVRIAVDDLGSGYANLDYVERLKPDFLKLDLSLVRGVDQNGVKQAMISSLVEVGRATGATVIAEGIETEKERDALRKLGVCWGQGFFFARPSPGFVESC